MAAPAGSFGLAAVVRGRDGRWAVLLDKRVTGQTQEKLQKGCHPSLKTTVFVINVFS